MDLLKEEKDLGLEELFTAHQREGKMFQINTEAVDDYDLPWLFREQVVEDDSTDLDEDLGLSWLFREVVDHFGEEDINEEHLGAIIKEKKTNKLYNIFLQENRLPSTPKRTHSPEDMVTGKVRRMTFTSTSEASPVLRRRLNSTPVLRRRSSKTKTLDPRQQLITNMLGDMKEEQ